MQGYYYGVLRYVDEGSFFCAKEVRLGGMVRKLFDVQFEKKIKKRYELAFTVDLAGQ